MNSINEFTKTAESKDGMESQTAVACRLANRVSLNMLYGETASKRDHAGHMMIEAFSATNQLLEQIDPVSLRDWFEQFRFVFSKTVQKLEHDPVAWSHNLIAQCDMLHAVRLHQKTIAQVGNELARWDRRPVTYEELGRGLNGLGSLVTENASSLGQSIERQVGVESASPRRSLQFLHSVCGVALVVVAMDQATEKGDPRDENCATMAMFGAGLTVRCVNRLCRACNVAILD